MSHRELTSDSDLDEIRFDGRGLVPVVAQDAVTGRVLMVAWANRDAVEWSFESGDLHFWSRSREMLWKKGETSGNTLAVRAIFTDCDGDTLLALVDPRGPACHTGDESCFGDASSVATSRTIAPNRRPATSSGEAGPGRSPSVPLVTPPPAGRPTEVTVPTGEPTPPAPPEASPDILDRLWSVIESRRSTPPEASYTARLLSDRNLVAKKLGEELAETLIAFAERDRSALTSESADLLYHLMVAWAAAGTSLAEVRAELEVRRS